MQKPKSITIDQHRLERFLARFCSKYHQTESGEALCSLRMPGECGVDTIDRIIHQCPSDCPHFSQRRFKPCKFGKCAFVKHAIKDIIKP